MSVSEVSAAATVASTSSTTQTGTTDLGEDTFLTLLTTQMQNQDPLEPMSNEDFVAQLAQFSSLEELQGISSGLESIYLLDASMNNAQMVNLIGQEVTAVGDSFAYSGEGSTELHYDAQGALSSGTVTITDADGTVVYTGDLGTAAEGEGSWTWDGKTTSGEQAPAGTYTFAVTGSDASGNEVVVDELNVGTVEEMSFESGTAQPTVNGVPIEIGDILRISTPGAGT